MAIAVAVLKDEHGKVLIHKRDGTGLLANLWEFPNCEVVHSQENPERQLEKFLKEEYGATVRIGNSFTALEHVFSHLVWKITVYDGKIIGDVAETEQLKLVDEQEIGLYAFPVSHQRIWKEYKKTDG